MRYAIFTDIHANLEALEAVLEKIDEIAQKKPIDQIWFLGDLVGYGPNPNECITTLRSRTDVIIAGNHDWAAVGKIDLDDFSPAARISAEWTAKQLTEEHATFLTELPERLEIGEATLVHGSPYGPLWEYLTSDVLAERSFQHFGTRYCFVGHTHVPVIFQQPDAISRAPTLPLPVTQAEQSALPATLPSPNGIEKPIDQDESARSAESEENGDAMHTLVVAHPPPSAHMTHVAAHADSAYADPHSGQTISEAAANKVLEGRMPSSEASTPEIVPAEIEEEHHPISEHIPQASEVEAETEIASLPASDKEDETDEGASEVIEFERPDLDEETTMPIQVRLSLDASQSGEIEELLELLGLSQSMIQVTNEMIIPPEGHWEAVEECRAIINPGGVGQPRDGDPRAAFMIYDTERGFEFYRIPYAIEKTQEKILAAGLPPYLAVRLAYGR